MNYTYTNTVGVMVGELIFIEFSCKLNQIETHVAKHALSYETLKKLHDLIGNIITDIEAKKMDTKKAN